MMEAVISSEMLVSIYQTAWHIPEDSHLHTYRCEKKPTIQRSKMVMEECVCVEEG
jgi:hypothetical protein